MKIHTVKKTINAISFIALSFFLTTVVLAQSNTGSITGVVTDPNGAVVPNATVVLDPVLVTEALPAEPGDVLACGPEPMLDALAQLVPGAQLAREAPMVCGYGACYGCVVEHDGRYVRLCLEGPVLREAA